MRVTRSFQCVDIRSRVKCVLSSSLNNKSFHWTFFLLLLFSHMFFILLKRVIFLDIDVHHLFNRLDHERSKKNAKRTYAHKSYATERCKARARERRRRRGKSYRIDASLFVLTIVYIEREGSFFYPSLHIYLSSRSIHNRR